MAEKVLKKNVSEFSGQITTQQNDRQFDCQMWRSLVQTQVDPFFFVCILNSFFIFYGDLVYWFMQYGKRVFSRVAVWFLIPSVPIWLLNTVLSNGDSKKNPTSVFWCRNSDGGWDTPKNHLQLVDYFYPSCKEFNSTTERHKVGCQNLTQRYPGQ